MSWLTKVGRCLPAHFSEPSTQVLAVIHIPRGSHASEHVSAEVVSLLLRKDWHREVAPSTVLHLQHNKRRVRSIVRCPVRSERMYFSFLWELPWPTHTPRPNPVLFCVFSLCTFVIEVTHTDRVFYCWDRPHQSLTYTHTARYQRFSHLQKPQACTKFQILGTRLYGEATRTPSKATLFAPPPPQNKNPWSWHANWSIADPRHIWTLLHYGVLQTCINSQLCYSQYETHYCLVQNVKNK